MPADGNVFRIKVDKSGRILLPAELRARHQISEGDTLVLIDDEQGLHVKTHAQVLAEAQAYFAGLAPKDVSLSKELLQDRRKEAQRE